MADFTTTPDCVNYMLRSMNELTDGTSPFQGDCLNHLNHVYRLMYAGGGELNAGEKRKPIAFTWARSQYPYVLTLVPPISTGTIAATQNSTTITFSSAPAASVAGYDFKVTNQPEVYRIATHTGGATTAVLDAVYVGTTITAEAFKVFKSRYSIGANILGLVTPIRVFSEAQSGVNGRRQIDIVDESQFDARYPKSLINQEFPSCAKVVYTDSNGSIDLEFNAYPQDFERLELPYVRIPTPLALVASDPILPIQWRPVLVEYALLFLYRDTNDSRASGQALIAKQKFEGVVSEAEGTTRVANMDYGRIYPRGARQGYVDAQIRTEDGFILTG